MKSFSVASFSSDSAETLARAQELVARDPQALFTDFQWFFFEARDTVFYTAYSSRTFDKDSIGKLVAELVTLAPQLTHGYVGARPGQPFPKHIMDAITSVEMVDTLEGYPDKWLSKSEDVYEETELPLFRVMVAQLKDGPNAAGQSSMIQVRASHAVMEGSDSALLTRSQSASHGVMSDSSNKVSWWTRVASSVRGWALVTFYVALAMIFAKPDVAFGFRTLAISRHRLRRLANKLGVRQRSLYFALITYALNGVGKNKNLAKKVIGATYTMLDPNRNALDDDFFRVRALEARFKVHDDFDTFVREVDETVGSVEQKDVTKFQHVVLTGFKTLRTLSKLFPGFPPRRFWRYSGPIDIVLTLVPPHRAYGSLSEGIQEPIFCGAYHAGANICTFCPGREFLALSFTMEERLLEAVDRIEPLLERIEARHSQD